MEYLGNFFCALCGTLLRTICIIMGILKFQSHLFATFPMGHIGGHPGGQFLCKRKKEGILKITQKEFMPRMVTKCGLADPL